MGTAAPLPLARLVGVGSIVFFANAALLVLQLVAGRLLAPFIGSDLYTWTSIIGVFLAGIALGNAFGGRLADRYPHPRTLAALLAGGAVAALWMVAFPMLLTASGVHTSIPLGPRIPLLAALLCLPAGFVLSLLTPVAIKLGLADVSKTGRVAGLVFALSTLGCLLGNYVTGFYLVPAFTINMLVYVAAGLLLALAAGAFVSLRIPGEPGDVSPPEVGEASSGGLTSPGSPSTNAFPDIRQAYLIVFLASFGGMTLELTASRLIAQFLGVSLFTWTGIIGVMLAGTALGNFTGGLLADRVNRPGSNLNPRFYLAATLMAGGAASVLIFVTMAIITRTEALTNRTLTEQVLGWTFSLFFLPMFLLGMVSPQVIRLAVPDVAHVGRVAGRVYAWSTFGAIVGTFAAGYVLISTLGVYRTILGVASVLTLATLAVVNVWQDAKQLRTLDPARVAPSAAPNSLLLYLFSIVLGGVVGGFILTGRGVRDPYTIVFLETNYYTIKVSERQYDSRTFLSLTLDHLVHSTVDPNDPLYLYYEHEHVQMEFLRAAREHSPEPKVLVIGGGGYTFPRCAKTLLPETQMDVVEIDPGVTRVAYEHLGLKKELGIHDINMDGRQFVAERAEKGSYDLIVQDAVNDLSVPAHLLTKEYNDAVNRDLKPNGVYLLTVIDSVEFGRLWRSAMRTLRETFAHVALLTPAAPPDKAADPAEWTRWAEPRQVYVIYAADHPIDPAAMQAAVARQTAAGGEAATIRTHVIPDADLKDTLDRDPGVILTDQYAPVDNLMAEVFRRRRYE